MKCSGRVEKMTCLTDITREIRSSNGEILKGTDQGHFDIKEFDHEKAIFVK